MAKASNIKRIERLRKKITEIDERVKNDLHLKQTYVKEIESLEAESILIACKSSNITVDEAVESFGFYNMLKSNSLTINEINELLALNNIDKTLSPSDTKFDKQEEKND